MLICKEPEILLNASATMLDALGKVALQVACNNFAISEIYFGRMASHVNSPTEQRFQNRENCQWVQNAVKNVPKIGCMVLDGGATTKPHASAPKSEQMQLDPDLDVNGIAKILIHVFQQLVRLVLNQPCTSSHEHSHIQT